MLSLGGLTPLAKALSAVLVVGSLAAKLSPRLLQAAGLVCAGAFTRPWTLLTCALVGDLTTVSCCSCCDRSCSERRD